MLMLAQMRSTGIAAGRRGLLAALLLLAACSAAWSASTASGTRFGDGPPGSGPTSTEALYEQSTVGTGGMDESPLARDEYARQRGEDIQLSLLTVGPGDPVYLWYGHTALIVTDRRLGTETLYDFGVFDFQQDQFYRNFAMGRLIYSITASPAAYRIAHAVREGRKVSVTSLDIPPEARWKAALILETYVQPGNNTYLYHHYYDNCATRIRDVIDAALDGQLRKQSLSVPGRMSYRDHIRRFSNRHYIMDWVLNFLQSGRIDESITRWDDLFLPLELEEVVTGFNYFDAEGNGRMLAAGTRVIAEADGRPAVPHSATAHWPGGLAVGIVLGGIGALAYLLWMQAGKDIWRILYGLYTGLYGLSFGLLGTGLLVMMLVTDHDVTFWNENAIIVSPLLIWTGLLGFSAASGRSRGVPLQRKLFTIQGVAGLALVLGKIVLPGTFSQQNWLTISLLVPALLLLGLPRPRYQRGRGRMKKDTAGSFSGIDAVRHPED